MSAHPYDVLSLNNGANIIFTPCPGTKTQNLADSIATLKSRWHSHAAFTYAAKGA